MLSRTVRRPCLLMPPRPDDYDVIRQSISTTLTTETFAEFLNKLECAGILQRKNVKNCMQFARPFILGAPVQLSCGKSLPGDHRVTLQDDIYSKRDEVRVFERANHDSSHGWRSHAVSKLVLFQLNQLGRWSIEHAFAVTSKRASISAKKPKRKLNVELTAQSLAIGYATPVTVAIPDATDSPPSPSKCVKKRNCELDVQPIEAIQLISLGVAVQDAAPLAIAIPVATASRTPAPLSTEPTSSVALASTFVPTVPPSYQQLLRCCALDTDLQRWLGDKLKTTQMREVVKKFYKQSPQHVIAAGLDPDLFSVDHIIPKNIGGLDHCFNYVLMPRNTNAHFGDRWTTDKKHYIGKHATVIASTLATWFRDRNDAMEDFSKFSPHRCI